MRIRRFRMLVGAIAFVLLLSVVFGVAGIGGSGTALGAATTLTVLSGDVSIRHQGDASFGSALDGEIVLAGDTVRTATDSRAVITYFEGSTVTIEPETSLMVESAYADGGNTFIQMMQLAGRTWHVVTKLASGGSLYELRTPSSTASGRGPEFIADTDADLTTITTTEGLVVSSVAEPNGDVAEVPVPAGTAQTQRHGERAAPAHPAPTPERTVSVTMHGNGLVVDARGRTNGVTPDGRLVSQTPGARVTREGSDVLVVLPDAADGDMRIVPAMSASAGHGESDAAHDAGLSVGHDDSGQLTVRVLEPDEMHGLAKPTVTPSGHPVPDQERDSK